REDGVRDDRGMLEDLQRINYDGAARDACLVKIAKAVGWWSRSLAVELKLFLPPELILKLRPLLRTNDVKCSYEVRRGYTRIDKRDTELIALRGHLIIVLRKVEPGDLVQVQLQSGKETWSSTFEPVDVPGIQLE